MIPHDYDISEFNYDDYLFLQNYKKKVLAIKIPNHSMKSIEDEFDTFVSRMQEKIADYKYR